jgi:hypothetical protein
MDQYRGSLENGQDFGCHDVPKVIDLPLRRQLWASAVQKRFGKLQQSQNGE